MYIITIGEINSPTNTSVVVSISLARIFINSVILLNREIFIISS